MNRTPAPTAPPLAKLALLLQLLILLALSVNGSWRKTVRLDLDTHVVAQAVAGDVPTAIAAPLAAAAVLLVVLLAPPRSRRRQSVLPTRHVSATRPLRITHRPPGQAPPVLRR